MIRVRVAPFCLIATVFGGASAEVPQSSSPTVIVRLYNLAEAPAGEIARATSGASRIFERIAVQLVWLDCSVRAKDARCDQISSSPIVLNLRLLPSRMQPPEGLPKGIFGFALMSTDGGFATTANVYFERVSEIADGRRLRRAVLLGAMMAHELGHLLLGIDSHSKVGLMTLPWGPKTLLDADRGMVGFSKGEANRVQQAVQTRVSATQRHAATRSN